jgi:hypothetical protein
MEERNRRQNPSKNPVEQIPTVATTYEKPMKNHINLMDFSWRIHILFVDFS